MICCSCGKEIDINYGREYWNGIYCKKCADEMLSTPEYIKIYKRIIADLQNENAALRERLAHSLELPYMEQTVSRYGTEDTVLYYMENGKLQQECFNNKFPEQLQARLAELKGGMR